MVFLLPALPFTAFYRVLHKLNPNYFRPTQQIHANAAQVHGMGVNAAQALVDWDGQEIEATVTQQEGIQAFFDWCLKQVPLDNTFTFLIHEF